MLIGWSKTGWKTTVWLAFLAYTAVWLYVSWFVVNIVARIPSLLGNLSTWLILGAANPIVVFALTQWAVKFFRKRRNG